MWGPVCEIEDYCSEVNWHIMTIENCAMWSSLMFVTRPASQLATMGFSEHKVETYTAYLTFTADCLCHTTQSMESV